jgi:putative ABC transport system ATP-binding protein
MNPLIQVSNVHKHYALGAATVQALADVSLTVHEGERVFLGGPSGCGKSTLLHLIGGLDKPSAGHVSVAAKRLDGTPDRELSVFRASHIGFVFQNFNLLPVLTVAENVEHPLLLAKTPMPLRERRARVQAILAEVGLADLGRHYPTQLSGGQRQRVAIARALVHEPLLLIADEPTANLDSKTGEQVLQLMLDLSLKLGSTVLICTHNPAFLERAERLVLMKDGRIDADRSRGSTAASAAAVAVAAHGDPATQCGVATALLEA